MTSKLSQGPVIYCMIKTLIHKLMIATLYSEEKHVIVHLFAEIDCLCSQLVMTRDVFIDACATIGRRTYLRTTT